MSIKDFFLKKMLQSKLKGVPKAEQAKVLEMLQKDPALFQKIALEVESLTKSGKDQMSAMMEVTQKYRAELENLMK